MKINSSFLRIFLDNLRERLYHKFMRRKPSNIDVIALAISKMLESPEFETEEQLIEWLKKENARPPEELRAEGRKAIQEAREELEKCTYLH